MEKKQISLFSVDNDSLFPLLCGQSLSNLISKYSFRILFFISKNHEKLRFEYWLAQSWIYFGLKFAKTAAFGGSGLEAFFLLTLFFLKLLLRLNKKNQILPYK